MSYYYRACGPGGRFRVLYSTKTSWGCENKGIKLDGDVNQHHCHRTWGPASTIRFTESLEVEKPDPETRITLHVEKFIKAGTGRAECLCGGRIKKLGYRVHVEDVKGEKITGVESFQFRSGVKDLEDCYRKTRATRDKKVDQLAAKYNKRKR